MNAARKSPPAFRFLLGAAFVALIAIPLARAEVNTNATGETKTLHEFAYFGGGPIIDPPVGVLSYIPVDGWQNGTVDLNASLKSGTTSGVINVSARGYTAGAYTVSVVTASSSSTVVLGTLTVTTGSFPGHPIPFAGAAYDSTVSTTSTPIFTFTSGEAKFGGKKSPFPDGFNPFDVATLSLTDSNSTVVATTTLTPVSSGFLNEVSPLVAGAAAPGATGNAVVRAVAHSFIVWPLAAGSLNAANALTVTAPVPLGLGEGPGLPIMWNSPSTGHIAIHAKGLPASTALTYAADGVDIGPVTTGTSGDLNLFATQGGLHPKLPSTLDLFSVKTVTVHDSTGAVYISAGF